jgi:2-polyprenyl-3-methyl-5-hydroxy-6-metoxy-1,4-benzoquinol methylase
MSDIKEKIASWWAENPMTYGVEHGTSAFRVEGRITRLQLGTREFFEKADQQLFNWNKPLHDKSGPFGKIFPYQKYRNHSVLEIGCGMGCMAMLWAQRGAQVIAVDLNPVAIEQTRKRFELFGLHARIQQEDANNLSFSNESFDYVFSWGVLHHCPNLDRSIFELFRVLKSGGGFGVMLYNRNSLFYWYHTIYIEGILHGELRFLNQLQLASRYGDGHRQEGNPYTWPVTKNEVNSLFTPYTRSLNIKLLGTELDTTFRHMLPGIYFLIPKL